MLLRKMGEIVLELHQTPNQTAEPSTPVPGHLENSTCDYFTTGCVMVVCCTYGTGVIAFLKCSSDNMQNEYIGGGMSTTPAVERCRTTRRTLVQPVTQHAGKKSTRQVFINSCIYITQYQCRMFTAPRLRDVIRVLHARADIGVLFENPQVCIYSSHTPRFLIIRLASLSVWPWF